MSLIELSWTAKNHLGTFFALFFGRVWNQKVQKCQYLAQNDYKCIFWVQIWPFLGQNSWFQREEAKGLVPTQRKTTYAPCLHRFLAGHETKWAKNADIWPKISAKFGCLWTKISFNIILLILAVRIIAIFILIDLLAFIFWWWMFDPLYSRIVFSEY